MKRINIGIIGRNFGYKVIYRALKNIKDFKVLGFSVKRKSNKFTSEKIKIYKNWKSLLSDKKIDAIFISSPPATHKKIIEYAIKKKKHIFCDKPVSTNLKNIKDLCKKLEDKKIINFVNYEFINIEAFNLFKKKYLPKLKVKKVNINWLIRISSKGRSEWKDDHSKGGGNFYNYICHILFYLEDFFGKIELKKSILKNENNKFKLNTDLYSKNKKINIKLNFKTIDLKSNSRPSHKVVFNTDKAKYILFTKANNIHDQFYLIKNKKIIFKPKPIRFDFRLKPTYKNIISFKNNIRKNKNKKPNFNDAKRVHYLVNKIINY